MIENSVRRLRVLSLTLIAACATAPPAEETPGDARPGRPSHADVLPPPGYGTLRQDDFTIVLDVGDVQIKMTPLDESVIRLAAPDTYQRLHGLAASRADRIREAGLNAGLRRDPLLFLVSFFTYGRQAEFTPTDLQLLSQGILYRPLGILPITPQWGREQLKQEESQSAVYLFDPAIDMDVTFRVEYGNAGTQEWGRIIRTLQAERGRVLSRAKP